MTQKSNQKNGKTKLAVQWKEDAYAVDCKPLEPKNPQTLSEYAMSLQTRGKSPSKSTVPPGPEA